MRPGVSPSSCAEVSGTVRILVVHGLQRGARKTTVDHVLAFARHVPEAQVVYQHIRQPGLPHVVREPFDLTVLSHCMLSHRTTPSWDEHVLRLERVRDRLGALAAMPQDDYKMAKRLDEAFLRLGVDRIYSPLSDRLDEIYAKSHDHIPIRTILTGYVEPTSPRGAWAPLAERPIDLGTRVRDLPAQYGRHGQSKGRQARLVADAVRARGLRVDVSTDPEDVLSGAQWMEFLGRCRFTLGSRGGASVIDHDGSVQRAVSEHLRRDPEATYDEIRSARFPDLVESPMTAISPRLLEAAATRTCQILSADEYLDLEPGVHYLELDPELANLEEISERLTDLSSAQAMADAAFEALVENPELAYPALVRGIVEECVGGVADGLEPVPDAGASWEALEVAPRTLGADLFEAFRLLLLQGFRAGWLEELEAVWTNLEELRSESRELAEQLLRPHLSELLSPSARIPAGTRDMAVAVARACSLVDGLAGCRPWFELARSGETIEASLWPWVSADAAAEELRLGAASHESPEHVWLREEATHGASAALELVVAAPSENASTWACRAALEVGAGERAAAHRSCVEAGRRADEEGQRVRAVSANALAQRLRRRSVGAIFAPHLHRLSGWLRRSSLRRLPGAWRLSRLLAQPVAGRSSAAERRRMAAEMDARGASEAAAVWRRRTWSGEPSR